jgi:hypothetical protein
MECVYDEVMDAGTECFGDVWDLDGLLLLFGDMDTSEYATDQPLDYDSTAQEADLTALFAY